MSREVNSTASTEDLGQLVIEAKFLIGKTATRGRAKDLLEEVVERALGTAPAGEALELLRRIDELDDHDEAQRREELTAWRDEWCAIQGLEDGRLGHFLERLKEIPVGLEFLLEEIERDLQRWIREQTEVLARSREEKREPEARRLETVVERIHALAEIPRFALALQKERQRFLDELYGLRLEKLRPDVEHASREWAIDEARELMKKLEAPPARFRALVDSLEEAIYDAAGRRDEIEDVLAEIPAEVATLSGWPDLRGMLESIREIQERDSEEIPGPWRKRLRETRKELLAASSRFLEAEARKARTADELSAFRGHYDHLRPERVDPSLEAGADWFEDALLHLGEELTDRVARCADSDRLAALMQELDRELADLPRCVAAPPWVAQLEKILEVWRQVENGERFSPLPNSELALPEMVPGAFRTQVDEHLDLLTEIDRAFEALERPNARVRESLEVARGILREKPEHAEARRLENEARTLELRRKLDVALSSWDLENFKKWTEAPETPGLYLELLEHGETLDHLATRVADTVFSSSQAAAAWWNAWQSAREELPARLPSALGEAIDRHQVERQEEWRLLLEELLDGDPSPEECRAAAASLAKARGEVDLDSYRLELERREVIGRLEGLLAEEHWDLADKRLAELSPDDPEYRRFETVLAIGRARTADVTVLARELHRRWSDVVTYCAREAHDLLEKGIEEAWRRGDGEALRWLQDVARRAAADERVGESTRERLADWLEWLQLERRLASELTTAGLRRFVAYLHSSASRDLERRSGALVERWRSAENLVALAWAYRALRDLERSPFPEVLDPAKLMEKRSHDTAEAVLSTLREEVDLSAEELDSMDRRLEEEAAAWRDLDDFLDLLPHVSERPRSPKRFEEIRELVTGLRRVLSTVTEIEGADLRRDGMESRWESARLRLEQLQREARFSPLPFVAGLLAKLEPLGSLTRLNFAEIQMRKAAERCGSSAPEDLDEKGLFARLAERIGDIVTEFRRAHQEGGAMWRKVGEEYWAEIPVTVGDLGEPPERAVEEGFDLPALAVHVETLEEDERRFRAALEELRRDLPWVGANGAFDPAKNLEYLALYPKEPPRSRRVFQLFDRLVRTAREQGAILEKSVDLLPAWITRYLEEGVP